MKSTAWKNVTEITYDSFGREHKHEYTMPVVTYKELVNSDPVEVVNMFEDRGVTAVDAFAYLLETIRESNRDIEGLHSGIKGRQDNVNRLAYENMKLKKRLAMYE